MPMTVVTGLFDTYSSAENAVRDLEAARVPDSDISVVANRTTDPVQVVENDHSAAASGSASAS